jgi:hypothetical protein
MVDAVGFEPTSFLFVREVSSPRWLDVHGGKLQSRTARRSHWVTASLSRPGTETFHCSAREDPGSVARTGIEPAYNRVKTYLPAISITRHDLLD